MYIEYMDGMESLMTSFVMLPKVMLHDKRFRVLSVESKVVYSLALDRVRLSVKNGWIDELRRVYIIMTIEEIMEDMDCAKQKAVKLLQELVDFGLIEKKRQGLGKPNLLYVKKFVLKEYSSKFQEGDSHTSGRVANHTSASPEIIPQGVTNSFGTNNNQNNTDYSHTDSFFPSAYAAPGKTEGMTERDKIKHQIEYDCLRQRYRGEQLDELVEIMLEVMMNRSPTIRIGRDAEYPTAYVQERLSKINAMHIERVMDGITDNRTQVYNTKAYLLATLFNSVSTIDSYNTMQYNHDFGSSW